MPELRERRGHAYAALSRPLSRPLSPCAPLSPPLSIISPIWGRPRVDGRCTRAPLSLSMDAHEPSTRPKDHTPRAISPHTITIVSIAISI